MLLLVTVLLGICIFTGTINTPLNDQLTSFKAPDYIPDGYVSEANNSTNSVDKSFTFADRKNNNYFIVAAVKDMNKSEYHELMDDSSASEQMEGMKTTAENITISGHPVTFRILTMDFMGMTMNMFHVTWSCPQTGLNIVATGKIEANETENMKKMITSIQCHTNKQNWKIPGL